MANYLSALDQLQGQKAAAGDIDGVVALKQERDRVTNHAQPTAADLQAMSAPVRKLRATYEADTRKAADEAVRRDKLARSSYLANLEALQKRMNAAGEIEQGLLVKAEKDRFMAELVANKGAVATTTSPSTSRIPVAPTSLARVDPKILAVRKVIQDFRKVAGDEKTDTFIKEHGISNPNGFGSNFVLLETLSKHDSWSESERNDAIGGFDRMRGALGRISAVMHKYKEPDSRLIIAGVNKIGAGKKSVLDNLGDALKAVKPPN